MKNCKWMTCNNNLPDQEYIAKSSLQVHANGLKTDWSLWKSLNMYFDMSSFKIKNLYACSKYLMKLCLPAILSPYVSTLILVDS